MNCINHNGNLLLATEVKIGANNRAFKYGDSLFETIKMIDGQLPFLALHYDRLQEGMTKLKMSSHQGFSMEFLRTEIKKLVSKGHHRIRLTVFRNQGGLYTPKDNHIQFIIEASPLVSSQFQLNEKGLELGISQEKYLSHTPISHLKTGNSLPYILAGLECQSHGWDNILLLNQQGTIAEALGYNVFVVIQGEIYTPPLSSGCIAGTMRRFLLEQPYFVIQEKEITLDMLHHAQALFLTNAIQGIQWVSRVGEWSFERVEQLDKLLGVMNLCSKTAFFGK